MMTRKVAAKELEIRITMLTKELDAEKSYTQQLLQEHKEAEEEMEKVILQNSNLKKELAELQCKYSDVVDQCISLQDTNNTLRKCYDSHEQALSQITLLEKSLCESNRTVLQYEKERSLGQTQTIASQSLFNELASPDCSLDLITVDQPTLVDKCITTDMISTADKCVMTLSCDRRCSESKPNLIVSKSLQIDQSTETSVHHKKSKKFKTFSSHKKYKTYHRINKFIRKTAKISKKLSCESLNFLLKKDYNDLISYINNMNTFNIDKLKSYEQELDLLSNKINLLKNCLIFDDSKSEHTLVADKCLNTGENCNINVGIKDQTMPQKCTPVKQCVNSTICPRNTIIFSDKIGQGFGSFLKNNLEQQVINICTPECTLSDIVKSISNYSISDLTTIIILFGNSSSVTKKSLITDMQLLTALQLKTKCKIIINAFPYSTCLTYKQNRHTFNLNLYMYNLTCQSDNIVFFDCNKFKFMKNFKLTRDTMYLSNKCKKEWATLVAYNIHDAVISNITQFTPNNISICTNNSDVLMNKSLVNNDNNNCLN